MTYHADVFPYELQRVGLTSVCGEERRANQRVRRRAEWSVHAIVSWCRETLRAWKNSSHQSSNG